MKKKRHEEHENHERWLISYADFITLLFAFFVVMYSTASINAGKLRAVSDAMSSAFHPFISFSASAIRLTREQTATEILKLDMGLYVKVVAELNKVDRQSRITVAKESRGIVIRMADKLLFEVGKAEVLPEAKPALDKIAALIRSSPNHVQIEGHTDNIPINTAVYPSNWELSAARAVGIMRYFVDEKGIDPDRFSIAGYAEYRPLVSNDTLEGRAKNRRVEIVLVSLADVTAETQDAAVTPEPMVNPAVAPPVDPFRTEPPAAPAPVQPIAPIFPKGGVP